MSICGYQLQQFEGKDRNKKLPIIFVVVVVVVVVAFILLVLLIPLTISNSP